MGIVEVIICAIIVIPISIYGFYLAATDQLCEEKVIIFPW